MLRNRVGGSRGGGTETVFQMRQRMFSIGDDFWIETNDGRRAFKVDGKALRIRKTLILEGPNVVTLVITTVPREDSAFSADWMMDVLVEAGRGDVVANAVTIVSMTTPRPGPPPVVA